WIERGDPIIQARFVVYRDNENPRGLFKKQDVTWSKVFTLKSPISGLLANADAWYCGYYSDTPQYTTSGYTGVYGNENIWPVLLIPKDEPPADSYNVRHFMHNLGTLAQQERSRYLCSGRNGPCRLKDNGYSEDDIETAEHLLSSYKNPRTGEPITRELNADDRQILSNLQSLRKHDANLRDKLADAIRAIDSTDFA
ncbi:MAG: hypothetical protein AAF085_17315, partial [Planctomycetota bacterium]